MQQQIPEWFLKMTAKRLAQLEGTLTRVQIASELRNKHLYRLWDERFHDTQNDFIDDCQKLPFDAEWWILSSEKTYPQKALHPTILDLLGLSYGARKNSGACKYVKWLT